MLAKRSLSFRPFKANSLQSKSIKQVLNQFNVAIFSLTQFIAFFIEIAYVPRGELDKLALLYELLVLYLNPVLRWITFQFVLHLTLLSNQPNCCIISAALPPFRLISVLTSFVDNTILFRFLLAFSQMVTSPFPIYKFLKTVLLKLCLIFTRSCKNNKGSSNGRFDI